MLDTPWPTISATLSDPQPGSGACPEHRRRVEPQSTTLAVDGQAVTPQVNSAEGFEYTPETRLADGSHPATAQVYDPAGNPAQTGPWTFSVETDNAPSLGVTKYYHLGAQRVAMWQDDQVYYLHGDHLGSTSLTTDQNGAVFAETRYLPYGEERWTAGDAQPTDFTFTGQREES